MIDRFVIQSARCVGGLALALLLAVAGCSDQQCVTQTTQYSASINTVGYFGTTIGQPIARFDLTQDFVTHTPYSACAQGPLQDVGVVQLKVTSLSTTPLALAFDVQGLNKDSIPVWKQPGQIARINPNETVDVGQIIVSPTRLDLGAKVILTKVEILP